MKEGIDYKIVETLPVMYDGNKYIKNVKRVNVKGIKKDLFLFDKENVVVCNPIDKRKKCSLEPIAVALFDYIIGCELSKKWEEYVNARIIFNKHWDKEYYLLID